MGQIKAIITDFDGTLVDTITANYMAYHEAFGAFNYNLTRNMYNDCFGLRYNELCDKLNIYNEKIRKEIKQLKKQLYPHYFQYTRLNVDLMNFIIFCYRSNLKTCIASLSSRDNMIGLLNYYNVTEYFHYILSGEDVSNPKPDPEIFEQALKLCQCNNNEAIIFEDSEIGFLAADKANINYIKVQL